MRQFYLYYYNDIYSQNTLGQHEKLPQSWWSYDGKSNE